MSSKMYNSLRDWRQSDPNAYTRAFNRGLLNTICDSMGWAREKPKKRHKMGHWTLSTVKKEARKYNTRTEFNYHNTSAYQIAQRNEWLDIVCSHMKQILYPDGYWTKKMCIADAKKYSTKTDWRKNNGPAVDSARRNGWYDACCAHMTCIIKPRGYWTKKLCLSIAKEYKSSSEWWKHAHPSWKAAYKNKWLEECCRHMKQNRHTKRTKKS